MSKIRILSDIIVSQISAGEVIETPASVVKELVENSLDASAKKVQIKLRSGGKRLISVIDNGTGMTRDNALMSIERHATSKIKKAEDLFNLKTLGFRGEALPSIASVSKFKLLTKSSEDISGTSIYIEGGKIKKVEDVGCPVGTAVEVKNLFYNTTPRLKFLKKNETELIRVIEVIQREAISNPKVSFEACNDDKLIFRFSAQKDLISRVNDVIPNAELYEINSKSVLIEVSGFMSSPYSTRSNTQKLYTYVNGRPVRDRFITRIIMDSYGKLIEKGKFPQGVLFIEVPSEDLDVNFHPTKHEIRFKNQHFVGQVIKEALQKMFTKAPWIKSYKEGVNHAITSFYDKSDSYGSRIGFKNREDIDYSYSSKTLDISDYTHDSRKEALPKDIDAISNEFYEESKNDLFKDGRFFSNLKVVGQVGALYIVCETEKGLIVIDQHAAHERINYEKFKKEYLDKGSIQTQQLLIPEVVELSPKESKMLEKYREEVIKLGFNTELFGENTFRIMSIPALLKSSSLSIKEIFIDLLDELEELKEGKSLKEHLDLICATIACHKSVRANQMLSEEKIYSLLQDLDMAEFPHSCPHGRPTAKEITFSDLEKMFRRI